MEIQDKSKDNEYLLNLIEKYDFIESIIITDYDGSLMTSAYKNGIEKSEEEKKDLRSALSYNFSISLQQISKAVKWNANTVTSFFDKHILYQRKLNDVALCHIVCNEKEYYHEVVKSICDELSKRFEPIEKKLMEIKKESE